MTGLRGFVFDPGDPSVGLFGPEWIHEDCPADEAGGWLADPGGVIEMPLAEVRVSPMTVRRWWLLTCTDCVQQVIVTADTDFDPTDEALAQEQAEQDRIDRLDWETDARLAAADDDPNPYSGTYSEM